MQSPLDIVLCEMEMTEEELKRYILSKAETLFDEHKVARFVEKGFFFRYTSVATAGYHYMITIRNGVNILF